MDREIDVQLNYTSCSGTRSGGSMPRAVSLPIKLLVVANTAVVAAFVGLIEINSRTLFTTCCSTYLSQVGNELLFSSQLPVSSESIYSQVTVL